MPSSLADQHGACVSLRSASVPCQPSESLQRASHIAVGTGRPPWCYCRAASHSPCVFTPSPGAAPPAPRGTVSPSPSLWMSHQQGAAINRIRPVSPACGVLSRPRAQGGLPPSPAGWRGGDQNPSSSGLSVQCLPSLAPFSVPITYCVVWPCYSMSHQQADFVVCARHSWGLAQRHLYATKKLLN